MKRALFAGVFFLGNVAGPAVASCSFSNANPTYALLTQSGIETLLGQSMACYPTAAPYENQEYHTGTTGSSTGNIIDYKKGPTDPVDPSKQIGSYSIAAVGGRPYYGTITYTYTGSPPSTFTYTVWGPTAPGGNLYDFCIGATPLAGGPVRIAPAGASPVPC